jgi:hypothetical protein
VCTLGAAILLALGCMPATPWLAEASAQGAQSGDQLAVKAAATELLEQYTLALESLDADAVKKVQPSVDTNQLKNAFRQMRSLEVEIDTIEVLTVTANTARVSCRVKQTLEPRAGSKQTTTVTRVLRLRKPQASWIIEAFER